MSSGTTVAQLAPEPINPTLPFNEALNGLLALTNLLGSLRPPEGSAAGAMPMIVLTAAGIEMRMSDSAPMAKGAHAINEVQKEWLQKIEDGLDSLRNATADLKATFDENAKKVDATLAAHATAIEAARAALTQNEQLMESMVELMGPADFTLPNAEEFANIS
ncbi:MAG: hypothetical protein JWP63_5606 [Candidatus Solibacter sp.]|jgi:hypothetical protein|nr:hypothetical protein [Candidatus Solibacter sp.]